MPFDVVSYMMGSESGGGTTTDVNAVHYTPESKTEAQKTQARQNIGAVSSEQLDNKQDKLTAGTNITIDENNVISATGGTSVTFDEKTIIKGTDNKYQTAIGGWKEVTPEQTTTLFIDTKGNGLPTFVGPGSTEKYEVGWDYNTTITSLVSEATTAVVNAKFTVLDTTFNNKVTLTKQTSIPASWESNDISIGGTNYKVKVYDQYTGENNGGISVISSDTGADLSDSKMESFALVTGAGSTTYHPIDNKFLNTNNSLSVDDNKLSIKGYGNATNGYMPVKDTTDGLKWVQPVDIATLDQKVAQASQYATTAGTYATQAVEAAAQVERKFWYGTIEEYNALEEVYQSTIYIILDE